MIKRSAIIKASELVIDHWSSVSGQEIRRPFRGSNLPLVLLRKLADALYCCAVRGAILSGHKDVNMATTQPDLPKADPPARGSVFTWTATVLACAYILWSGTMLYLATPKFIDMFSSMGVDLPLPTRLVIAFYRFAYPVLFGGAAALVIAKQFLVREKWVSLSITLAAVVMVNIIRGVTVWALYQPLFDMMEKLSK